MRYSKIFIAGHTGLVGQAFVKKFKADYNSELLLQKHKELDLTNQGEVSKKFSAEKPDFVILAVAKVGGIKENSTYPADILSIFDDSEQYYSSV